MRGFYFIVGLVIFVDNSYGVHDLLINNSTSATVGATDLFEITCKFEQPGAKARGIIYLDTDGNGHLDTDDPWFYKIKLIDGSFDDEDETADARYRQIYGPFRFSGKFILLAEDNGVADTVSLTVTTISSAHSISGKITTPENQPNILVCLLDIITREFKYGSFTDNTGAYFFCVPNEDADRWWNLVAMDPAVLLPYYGSNCPYLDSIYVSGAVNKDLAMNSCLSDSSVVYGVLRDNTDAPITESTIIDGRGFIEQVGYYLRPVKTDNNGAFRIYFPRVGIFRVYGYSVSATMSMPFYSEFMNTPTEEISGFGPSPAFINLDLTAYRIDTIISGRVYKEGNPYDGCELSCGAPGIGGTYTRTYSDGQYKMPVAKAGTQYTIKVEKNSIPPGYTSSPPEITVAPGDTGVNFTLTSVGTEENTQPQLSTGKIDIYPNPCIYELVVKLYSQTEVSNLVLYDITGKCVAEITPQSCKDGAQFTLSKALPSGIYFYSLKIGEKVRKGKIVKLR